MESNRSDDRDENGFFHQPVLVEEVLRNLITSQDGVYVDCTIGGGGHALQALEHLSDKGLVIGMDRDQDAVDYLRKRAGHGNRLLLFHENFRNIGLILNRIGHPRVDGMLFDLGVSSHQLDQESRGFSYSQDGPLDMRMDRRVRTTARDIVNRYPPEEIKTILSEYGEERWASRIAKFIDHYRQEREIQTTGQLVKIIKEAIPASARRKGGHPARRTFQALRIAVNDELNILKETLQEIPEYLKPGGRICVVSFHSLEDRIVKRVFRRLSRDCICPPDFPVCTCDHEQVLEVLTRRPITPDDEEVANNPRSRSAKLRVAQKKG